MQLRREDCRRELGVKAWLVNKETEEWRDLDKLGALVDRNLFSVLRSLDAFWKGGSKHEGLAGRADFRRAEGAAVSGMQARMGFSMESLEK